MASGAGGSVCHFDDSCACAGGNLFGVNREHVAVGASEPYACGFGQVGIFHGDGSEVHSLVDFLIFAGVDKCFGGVFECGFIGLHFFGHKVRQ